MHKGQLTSLSWDLMALFAIVTLIRGFVPTGAWALWPHEGCGAERLASELATFNGQLVQRLAGDRALGPIIGYGTSVTLIELSPDATRFIPCWNAESGS
jgi:hypothetical protein